MGRVMTEEKLKSLRELAMKKKAEEIVEQAYDTLHGQYNPFAQIKLIEQALLEAYAEGRKSVLNEWPSNEQIMFQINRTYRSKRLAVWNFEVWIKQYLSERVKT
jgi:hypothetical protein